MRQVELNEARASLLALIEAAIRGEDVFIMVDHQQAVKLIPVELPERHAQFGSAKGLFKMSDDFDAPLADFDECTVCPARASSL